MALLGGFEKTAEVLSSAEIDHRVIPTRYLCTMEVAGVGRHQIHPSHHRSDLSGDKITLRPWNSLGETDRYWTRTRVMIIPIIFRKIEKASVCPESTEFVTGAACCS